MNQVKVNTTPATDAFRALGAARTAGDRRAVILGVIKYKSVELALDVNTLLERIVADPIYGSARNGAEIGRRGAVAYAVASLLARMEDTTCDADALLECFESEFESAIGNVHDVNNAHILYAYRDLRSSIAGSLKRTV